MQSSMVAIQNSRGPYLPLLIQKLLHILPSRAEQTQPELVCIGEKGAIECGCQQDLLIFVRFHFHLE